MSGHTSRAGATFRRLDDAIAQLCRQRFTSGVVGDQSAAHVDRPGIETTDHLDQRHRHTLARHDEERRDRRRGSDRTGEPRPLLPPQPIPALSDGTAKADDETHPLSIVESME